MTKQDEGTKCQTILHISLITSAQEYFRALLKHFIKKKLITRWWLSETEGLAVVLSWFWLPHPNIKHGGMITLNSFILPVCFDFSLQMICLFSQFEPGDDMALRPEQQLVCNWHKQQLPLVQCTFCLEVLFWSQVEHEALLPTARDAALHWL